MWFEFIFITGHSVCFLFLYTIEALLLCRASRICEWVIYWIKQPPMCFTRFASGKPWINIQLSSGFLYIHIYSLKLNFIYLYIQNLKKKLKQLTQSNTNSHYLYIYKPNTFSSKINKGMDLDEINTDCTWNNHLYFVCLILNQTFV